MNGQLLVTKLSAPQSPPVLVARSRLSDQLKEGMGRKLTLISAPAGFGKTTLLGEWRMVQLGEGWPTGWVSLEQSDNDVARFWTYVITALQTLQSDVGEGAASLLRSPQTPIESVLSSLINDIAEMRYDFSLVLDDYHVMEAEAIHSAVTFLLEHMPPEMHLIISGRTDPSLPLARLPARGQLTQLVATDLRCTLDEATTFLNEVMDLSLSAEAVATVEARTEGWIAGLQLAALSIREQEDISEFISAFTGRNRHVLDYLNEEVLGRQPEPLKAFLLRTSILNRLNGALCDAVVGGDGAQETLEILERSNFFVVALDEERHW